MIDQHYGWNRSYKPLFIGFILSLLLTAAAYRIMTKFHLTHSYLEVTLFIFATIQSLIQLIFFLHLGVEEKPRWNLMLFLFTVMIVIIVVGGSIWIMNNLRYNMMIPGGK